jgi:hypothetical protein
MICPALLARHPRRVVDDGTTRLIVPVEVTRQVLGHPDQGMGTLTSSASGHQQ